MNGSNNKIIMLKQIQEEILSYADIKKAKNLQRFFKTAKGEYGEGDRFLGIVVPIQRSIANKYTALTLPEIEILLHSPYHEYRLIALLILVAKTKKTDQATKKTHMHFYLSNSKYINNWDLIDLTAHHVVGEYLLDKNKDILLPLARSTSVWERRIAMLSCFAFIKVNMFDDALAIARLLLYDSHDLIHKAVGWMLREIGKRNLKQEEMFLKKYYSKMPRTMLRYAIERFPEIKRQAYLKGIIKERG